MIVSSYMLLFPVLCLALLVRGKEIIIFDFILILFLSASTVILMESEIPNNLSKSIVMILYIKLLGISFFISCCKNKSSFNYFNKNNLCTRSPSIILKFNTCIHLRSFFKSRFMLIYKY